MIPDHSTISRFRIRYMNVVTDLLGQCIGLCAQAGLVNLGVIAIDGTKIQADASLAANRTYETLAKELEKAAMALDQAKAQANNAQLAVTADQIILAVSVTNEANDQAQCLPMQRHRKGREAPRGRQPKGLTPAQRMKRGLDTKLGQRTYALRGQTVEPVNGQLKADGAGQMLRRGLSNQSDFTAACIAHNFKKLWRHGQL